MANPKSAIGFTLIEMLVVIAIILLLLGLLVASIGQFTKLSTSAATQQMLQSINMALQMYEGDFDAFPPSVGSNNMFGVATELTSNNEPSGGSNYPWNGAELMTQALVAPLPATGTPSDGLVGNGFKQGGKTYGPYLEIKHDKTLRTTKGTQPHARYGITVASSALGAPILYYRKNPSASGTSMLYDYRTDSTVAEADWAWGPDGQFDTTHNNAMVALVNGGNPNQDSTGVKVVENYWARSPHGADDQTEEDDGPTREQGMEFGYALRSAQYLLVAAGVDDKYGTKDDTVLTGP